MEQRCRVCGVRVKYGRLLCGCKKCWLDWQYRQNNLAKNQKNINARREYIYFESMAVARERWS